MITVEELIQHLGTFPQDLPVAYSRYSEQKLLENGDIVIEECCIARQDGWIQSKRSDMPSIPYLLFPGN